MSVTACNDNLNAKTLNVKFVSAMCDKCVLIDKHAMCVLNSVAKPLKKTVASESNKKPRNLTRKLYERVSKTCSWWYPKFTPSGYKWKPKSGKENVNPNLVEIALFIVDSGCSKHMTGNLKLLINFVEKFLGTIHQSPRGIFINQAKYAQEILKKHGMTSCDSIGTPMATKHLDADLSGTPVDQTKYRSKVRALMYLTASKPDIMHATYYCACYPAQPTEKHLTAVKRIFRYLKDTIHMGLWYPKDTGFELTAFSDSDHVGCLDSRKSTSGGIKFLGADKLLTDYGFHFDKIPMYCDSKEAIAISCNPVQHLRTKHIDVRYHFIKKKVEKGIIELFFVGTEYQLADLFTKALPEERFKYLVR
nr:hypothetical protein [Tanacetum cinerariifolium]